MSNLSFSFELAQQLFYSEEAFPVDLDDAWIWLGYSSKQKAVDKLKSNFKEGKHFLTKGVKSPSGGRPGEWLVLSVDCFKSMGMMASTTKGDEIRSYFLKCENELKQIKRERSQPQSPQLLPVQHAMLYLDFADRFKSHFGELNPTMQQIVKDGAGNALIDGQRQLLGVSENWMGVVNFAELELGYSVPMKGKHCRTNLGKWIAFYCSDLAETKDRRLCNETQQNIWVYPLHIQDVRDRLEHQIRIFFKHPEPTAQLKADGAYKKQA